MCYGRSQFGISPHTKVGNADIRADYGVMLSIRKLVGSMFVATAAAAIAAAPTGVMLMTGSAGTPGQTAVAQPHGSGGPDGNGGGGGCGHDAGWQGCGGFVPGQGGFGHGCFNGICGSWDGGRGWFSG